MIAHRVRHSASRDQAVKAGMRLDTLILTMPPMTNKLTPLSRALIALSWQAPTADWTALVGASEDEIKAAAETAIAWCDEERQIPRKTMPPEMLDFEAECLASEMCHHAREALSQRRVPKIKDPQPIPADKHLSGSQLMRLIRQVLLEHGIVAEAQMAPEWLNGLAVDLLADKERLAFVYYGHAHLQRAAGRKGNATARDDARRRELCRLNNYRLVELKYGDDLTHGAVRQLLNDLFA